MKATKGQKKTTLTCENGHRRVFYVDSDGFTGEFARGDYPRVEIVPSDSYAYTHGGGCYRAAVDHLNRD